jgi:hypothetical protein
MTHIPPEQLSPRPRDHRDTLTPTSSPRGDPTACMPVADGAPPNLLEGYISDGELCRQLHIIDRTSRKWRQTGEGPPFVKIGHGIYYPIDEFQKWLKKRTVNPRRW